jgi:hypothetical protein
MLLQSSARMLLGRLGLHSLLFFFFEGQYELKASYTVVGSTI